MTETLSRAKARSVVAEAGVELLETGLTQRTSGNVSARCGPEEFAISPSGVPYGSIEPTDVPILDLAGAVVAGDQAPSSETPMHAAVYRERPGVGGIAHTHSPYATTFACLGRAIEPVHYLLPIAGSTVEVADYARHGTAALAANALAALEDRRAVLLRNHGVLAVGPSLAGAVDVAARVEFCARMYYQALQLGDPDPIDDDLDATAADLR